MNSKVFCAGCSKHSLGFTLYSFDKRNCHLGNMYRIFAIGFLSSSPSWVSKEVYIRGPDSKSLINISISVLGALVISGSCFNSYAVTNFLHKLCVKSCAKSYRLWKYSSGSTAGKSMKAFIPPVVLRNTKSLNSRSIITQLRCHLIKGHLGYKFFRFFSSFFSFHLSIYQLSISKNKYQSYW